MRYSAFIRDGGQLGTVGADELERWYRFHLGCGNCMRRSHPQRYVRKRWNPGRSAPDPRGRIASSCRAHETLWLQLRGAHELVLPPLTNMTAGAPLGPFLLAEPLMDNLSEFTSSLDGGWVQRLMSQKGEVIDKAARVLIKSLGGLLVLQERLTEQWNAERALARPPEQEPGAPAPRA
ncbi:hypothetical protein [Gemmata sp. SH-PL17]|uniref:hypothetical protein n=1 Tax=Gemmata sp. SH-PL17 TaxID=1630693 RepID=UPI0012F8D1B2|nr:hypothetical protein [Gemmata sp. SH-PL17]